MRRIALAAAAVLALAGCGGDDDGGGGSASCDGSIKVGSVSTLSGAATFPDVPNAAKAVFDQANAKGGVKGCKIDYDMQDDKGDPQVATQAARDLVQNQGVVALVGSGSLLDCEVNGAFYRQQQISAIQGLGVDGACWSQQAISPVNVGPFVLSTAMLYYASQTLKDRRICPFFIIIAGTKGAYQQAVDDWTKLTGMKPALVDFTVPAQGDYTPYVLRARDAGCDAVLTNLTEPQIVPWMKAVERQRVKGIDWLFLAPGYTEQVAKALGSLDVDLYAGTEWEPFTDADSPANAGWRKAMTAARRPLTAFSQGGYEAATVFLEVLRGIDGEINRESVTKALREMKPIDTPLTGTPYVFGPGDRHASNRATKIMKLEGGAWKVVTPDWVVLPGS